MAHRATIYLSLPEGKQFFSGVGYQRESHFVVSKPTYIHIYIYIYICICHIYIYVSYMSYMSYIYIYLYIYDIYDICHIYICLGYSYLNGVTKVVRNTSHSVVDLSDLGIHWSNRNPKSLKKCGFTRGSRNIVGYV